MPTLSQLGCAGGSTYLKNCVLEVPLSRKRSMVSLDPARIASDVARALRCMFARHVARLASVAKCETARHCWSQTAQEQAASVWPAVHLAHKKTAKRPLDTLADRTAQKKTAGPQTGGRLL